MPKNPRRGVDSLDVQIAELVEEEPWLTNTAIGKKLGINHETVGLRRARKEWGQMFDARHVPVKARWKANLKPALRRRLAMIATSKNDTAAIQLAERIMPEEVKPVSELKTDERDLAFARLAATLADWISGGRPGPGDRVGAPGGKARRARGAPAARH